TQTHRDVKMMITVTAYHSRDLWSWTEFSEDDDHSSQHITAVISVAGLSLVSVTVQTHDSDAIRFHRFEWACCSVWKQHFQTDRDDTKQSDWPLPGKTLLMCIGFNIYQLLSVASPKTMVYVTMDWLPLKCMGLEYRVARNGVMGLHLLDTTCSEMQHMMLLVSETLKALCLF